MSVDTAPRPAPEESRSRPAQPIPWSHLHTAALLVITGLFVWMAVRRPWGLYKSWLVVLVLMAAFVFIAGHGIKGVWRGAFVDRTNRMSLSRLQMLTWTLLVVSAFGCIAIARAVAPGQDPAKALDIAVPTTIWLVMGISTSSLIGSPLIKDAKQRKPAPADAGETLARQGLALGKDVRPAGRIVVNVEPEQARWSDLFTGEEVSNVTYLDLGKVQMFFFTVLLVLAYGVAIGAKLNGKTLPDGLPEVGEGMVTLLGISHAGYLATKAAPNDGQASR